MTRKTRYIITVLAAVSALGTSAQSAYDFSHLQREKLGRGVVAVRENPSEVTVSWRYLSSDPDNQSFDIYRDGKKINNAPVSDVTFYRDNYTGSAPATYEVKARRKGGPAIGSYTLPADAPEGYVDIPLQRPAHGVDPFGKEYFYNANDASIGDVDGDGEYEIILKWDPTNSRDNSQNGFTGQTYLDCYELDGTLLWRIDLGDNIRSGAHYTQFLVADFDGDGCAELICKTADGTRDGVGKVIGDYRADWREEVLMRADDNNSLRLYVTPIPTPYRFHTFMEDPAYRASVANQNIAYNQPAEPGFYFGPDLKGKKFRGTLIK